MRLDTLAGIPGLMKTLDAQNEALNGKPFNAELKNLVQSLVGPVKEALTSGEAPAEGE